MFLGSRCDGVLDPYAETGVEDLVNQRPCLPAKSVLNRSDGFEFMAGAISACYYD